MSLPLSEGSDEGRTARLLFLTARRADYEPLLEEFDFEERLHQNHPYYLLETPTGDLRLSHLGMGKNQVRKTLKKLAGTLDPDFVLTAGTAGALKEDFSRGDVFVPTALSGVEREDWLHPPTDLLRWTMGTLQQSGTKEYDFRSGPLVSVDEPVLTPDDRKELHAETGALAVDMESLAVVETLVENVEDPPAWSLLRVISDTFEDSTFEDVKNQQAEGSRQTARTLSDLIDSLH